ncbi:AMP-binding protein [Candidatus Contendibacter odensensis]|uniref:Fused 2-acylglycerophospho-ethanolamine acyl transferase acyl-acyl carrier protein synthetase n=1 Tax=Candidatus Contendobacter odensis Run_B_J11 TaxID=1400861 RepID=A0A7U7J5L9_9GAMM|nr:AMP-binding protein [Candidatus Contendobacter odensis]CDH47499.1 putative fused 2-acylglycerophospho-ethanolamine acyl transferase; acyl-acyl carrier protein synthetase [Candidatus Contendobacter odensis Run_B_J11]
MRRLLQRLARYLFRGLFRVELRGWEHYPHHEPRLLIIANHVSYLDGALLAAFLPDLPVFVINTHMARHWWIKPFIAITRHISIDPTNPLYLKILIQHLKAGERVAVFPEGRISVTGALMKIYEGPALAADKADAALLPVYIEGAQYSLLSRLGGKMRRQMLPHIRLTLLPPRRLTAIAGNGRARRQYLGRQLDEWMTELAYAGTVIDQPLVVSMLETWKRHSSGGIVLEDAQGQRLGWRALFTRAFILAELLEATCVGQRNVGLLLPNAAAAVISLLALHLRGRVPVILNFTAGIHDLISACRTAEVRTICTSRTFVVTANLQAPIAALSERFQMLFLEDVRPRATLRVKLRGLAQALVPEHSFRHWAGAVRGDDPAVILFTSGSERAPKGVVLTHRNLLANVAQARAMLDIMPCDVILNPLPLFHAFGLTTATLTPLLLGTRVILYPSPLHYHLIPELAYERSATVLFGTNTFLMGYGRHADPYDFFRVRLVVMGAEPLREETRRLWAEKFGLRISEGYGLTEASPVVATNSRRHHRSGTVGKLAPGLDYYLEPVAGIVEGGLLCVRGANVMAGYLRSEQPGCVIPPQTQRGLGWHDTGDIVRIDSDGFITLLGRAKRFAKIGGEMISLTTVEQLAADCWPEDQHTALNLPDPVKGESIVLLTTHRDADRQELIAATHRAGLSELHLPRQVIVVREIPLLGSGKPDYSGARRLAEKLSEAGAADST